MPDAPGTKTDIDEIMRRIKEEVKRRQGLLGEETDPGAGEWAPRSSAPEDHTVKKSFDNLLWKYGRRYKRIVKRVPVLKDFAKKEHSRLAHQFMYSPTVTPRPFPSPLDIQLLTHYINYHGFLVQARKEEGLKGRVKSFLFKFIRFFAWWQEQINRAFYQELMAQRARLGEKERRVQELLHEQRSHLKEELSERDKRFEEWNHRFAGLNQASDHLSRELSDQRAKIAEAERGMENLLRQQGVHLTEELAERDKVLEALGNRLHLVGEAGDHLSRELSDQKRKMDETEKTMGALNDKLVQFSQIADEFNRALTAQKDKLRTIDIETKGLLSQGLDNLKSEFAASLKNFNDTLESTQKELSGLLEVKSVISDMAGQMKSHKLNILDQQRRLTLLLEEAKKRLPKPIGTKQIKNIFREENHLFDAMYVDFEEQFRGSSEDIKERLKVYLPYVKQAKIGTKDYPIVDLGCGRGEWLELLKEEGHVAKGIEINRVMLDVCREKGLDVFEAHAIEYLRSRRPNSYGAITGFHLVEHLSLKDLISLFDESLRVLAPQGIIIFETPNPENLIVGAYAFHLDPTHQAPLVPASLNFIARQRGFVNTDILRLHKYSDFNPIDPATDDFKNKWFYSETDFALIGYKS